MSSGILPEHIANAAKAKSLYTSNLNPEELLADWRFAVRDARKLIGEALRASAFLTDIAGALEKSGRYGLVFRYLMAPPISQDQFKLLCPTWSKDSENEGKPAKPKAASDAASAILARLDPNLVRWVGKAVNMPGRKDLRNVLNVTAVLIAQQKLATARRTRLASEQELAVAELLESDGWARLPSKLIDTRAAVPPRHYMHKTRFATKTRPQEVDVACGLNGTYVLAMECKVTNDETNSVKRINDVLKKASAWQEHWGSFVLTAALLAGVVAPKDVQRLTDANVEVFWSHDLDAFRTWIAARV